MMILQRYKAALLTIGLLLTAAPSFADGTAIREKIDYRTVRTNGHTIYGSDGTRYQRNGKTIYSSTGTRYRTSGHTIYGSDGTRYRINNNALNKR